jgi:hypothetical protein
MFKKELTNRGIGRLAETFNSVPVEISAACAGNFEHFARDTAADNNGTVPLRFNNEARMVAGAGVLIPHEGADHA